MTETRGKLFETFGIAVGAIALVALVVLAVGDSPILVAQVLLASAFGSLENLSYSIFYATPILLTACSVRVALAGGLFNIGAEGQMYVGALAATAVGLLLGSSVPALFTLPLAIGAAMLFSAFWSGIAAWLRVKYSVHEVISTILLNFVAFALINWAVLEVFKNPENQSVETSWITENLRILPLWGQATKFAPVAVFVALLLHWILNRTWFGFRVRATGQNPKAAEFAGIESSKVRFKAMFLAGALSGLAGFNEVFCHAYRLIDGFSPGYGFMGLAVALIARNSLGFLFATSLLFGALQKGALDLDLETERITRDLAAVIQAVVLLALALQTRVRK